jgi:hypothetical protein
VKPNLQIVLVRRDPRNPYGREIELGIEVVCAEPRNEKVLNAERKPALGGSTASIRNISGCVMELPEQGSGVRHEDISRHHIERFWLCCRGGMTNVEPSISKEPCRRLELKSNCNKSVLAGVLMSASIAATAKPSLDFIKSSPRPGYSSALACASTFISTRMNQRCRWELPPAAGHFHENASLTLFIAGCFRFFTLIQCFDRPPR